MEVFSIGKTRKGRNIPAICFGDYIHSNSRQLIITAAIHGREYLNTEMLLYFLSELDFMESKLRSSHLCVYILPLLNPDGVQISRQKHPRFRGNARGIDLNRNFPIGHHPSSANGLVPSCEPEVKAMMNFINSLTNPVAVLHYHSVGSLIYWDYRVEKELRKKIYALARFASKQTGYPLAYATKDTVPNGGFGDWCAYAKKIPTITIETGHFFAPVPHWQYRSICRRNLPFLKHLIYAIGRSDSFATSHID